MGEVPAGFVFCFCLYWVVGTEVAETREESRNFPGWYQTWIVSVMCAVRVLYSHQDLCLCAKQYEKKETENERVERKNDIH